MSELKVDVKQLMKDWENCTDDGSFSNGHPIYLMAVEIDYLRDKQQKLQAKLESISKASSENNLDEVKRLTATPDYKVIMEKQAEAVTAFVNNLIGAFESGFTDRTIVSLAELHRVMQTHVADNYQAKIPHITELWGDDVAESCGFDVTSKKLRNTTQLIKMMVEKGRK